MLDTPQIRIVPNSSSLSVFFFDEKGKRKTICSDDGAIVGGVVFGRDSGPIHSLHTNIAHHQCVTLDDTLR